MNDIYTLPNTPEGHALRNHVAAALASNGITSVEREEVWSETTVLILEVTGCRKGHGQIAREMKERKQ